MVLTGALRYEVLHGEREIRFYHFRTPHSVTSSSPCGTHPFEARQVKTALIEVTEMICISCKPATDPV